jgi:hypothetical protein
MSNSLHIHDKLHLICKNELNDKQAIKSKNLAHNNKKES